MAPLVHHKPGRNKSGRHAFSRTHAKRAPLTPAQKAQVRDKKTSEQKLFDDLALRHEQDFNDLAKETGRSVEYVRMRFNRNTLKIKKGGVKRKVNVFNAFQHMKAKERDDSGRGKLIRMAKDQSVIEEYNALSQEDKAKLVTELESHNDAKANASHHLVKAQATDVDLVAQDLRLRLTSAENRNDLHYLLLIANRNPRAYQNTKLLHSTGVEEFTRTKLKWSPTDLAVAFEAWSVGHGHGAPSADSDDTGVLNSEARSLLRENWESVTGKTVKPVYSPIKALETHHVEFVGWPGGPPNFNQLNTAAVLKKLIAAVKAGTATWRMVEEDDVEDLLVEFQARAERGEMLPKEPRKQRSDKGKKKPREPLATLNGDA